MCMCMSVGIIKIISPAVPVMISSHLLQVTPALSVEKHKKAVYWWRKSDKHSCTFGNIPNHKVS